MSMRPRFRVLSTVIALLLLLSFSLDAAEKREPTKEVWQSLALRSQRIGYGHLVESRSEQNGRTIILSDMRLHTVMKRFDGKLTLIIDQQVQEDADGNLLSFTFHMDNPPASRMEMSGRVDGDVLKLTTKAGGKTTESEIKLGEATKSPVYLDRLLEESPLKEGESRTLSLFDPQLGTVVTVKAVGQGQAEFKLPDGESQEGSRVVVEYLTGIPGLTVDCYFDAQGRGVLNESNFLGTTTWNVSQEEALAEIPADVDVGLAALIKIDAIPDSHQTSEVEYQVTLASGLDDGLIPQGVLQSLERVDAETVKVSVKSLRPAAVTAVDVAPPDAKYLAATAMARCDDEAIVELAGKSAPDDADSAEIAVKLESAVHKWLNRKNMSTNLASASEVVRSREGDCTEHAVLLTAMLRARKVPARTVVGLVYWDQFTAFAGHAWTEAWINGHWVPLDATQAKGGIGADHIKLADSSLADGDAGVIAGSVATWRLLDQAKVEVLRIVHEQDR